MSAGAARAHIAGEKRLRDLVAAALVSLWAGLSGYDEENVDEWLTRALPVVLGAQRQSVALTEAFFARSLGRQPLGVNPTNLIGPGVRNGSDPREVYRRPFVTLWSGLKESKPFEEAAQAALERATVTAQTDVQLSMRATAREIAQADPEIFGFRRVTDGDACDLCLIASTQRYHVSDLLPIHGRCGCGVEPITEPTDRVIDSDLLRKLKAEGAIDKITRQRRAARLKERGQDPPAEDEPPLTAEVREHGELGPVLVNADHHFTQL